MSMRLNPDGMPNGSVIKPVATNISAISNNQSYSMAARRLSRPGASDWAARMLRVVDHVWRCLISLVKNPNRSK